MLPAYLLWYSLKKKTLDAKITLFRIYLTFPFPPRRYSIPVIPRGVGERCATSAISIKYWLNIDGFGVKLLLV